MMLRFALALALSLVLATPASAQNLASGKVNTGTPTFSNDQNVPLQLDATGALKVTGGGGAQGGSVTPAGTSGTQAQAVQGITGGVPQNIAASSLPLPTGAATSANQASEIAALGAIGDSAYAGTGNASTIAAQKGIYAATVARQSSFVEANSAAIAANGLSPQTARTPGTTYTKFNATAGCTAANANLVVDGSNDGFASYVTVAITAVAANSRNSGSAGSTITAPVNFTSYRAYVANGATANTCSVVSSFTVN